MRARVCVAIAVLIVAVASPAMAEVDVESDPRNDLSRSTYAEDSTEAVVQAAQRTQRRADITRFRTAHRPHRLLMRLQVREVKRESAAQVNVAFSVRDSNGRGWTVLIRYWKRVFVELTRLYPNRAPADVPCRGLRAEALRKQDAYAVSLPRRCIRSPRWVRTGSVVGLSRFVEPYKTWGDRARADILFGFDAPPDFGPRLRSGRPAGNTDMSRQGSERLTSRLLRSD